MKTILYLGNTYCSNIAELRDIIKKSPAQDSLLGKELLCALKDGTLARWLSEGEEEEQSLVKKLPQIQSDSSDSDLLKKLGECLKSDYRIQTFQISDFFVLNEVNISLKCPNDDVVKMFFHFTFGVDRTIGEKAEFRLRIRRDQEILECTETKEINLRELNKSLEIEFNINNKEYFDDVATVVELVSLFMGHKTVVWNKDTEGIKRIYEVEEKRIREEMELRIDERKELEGLFLHEMGEIIGERKELEGRIREEMELRIDERMELEKSIRQRMVLEESIRQRMEDMEMERIELEEKIHERIRKEMERVRIKCRREDDEHLRACAIVKM